MTDAPPKKTWKRQLAAAIAVAAVLVLAVLWWAGGAHARRLAAIRAAGDPASLADLEPAPIPPNQNAAAIIDSLTPQIEVFAQAHGAFYKTDVGKAYDSGEHRFSGAGAPTDQLQRIRAILDQFPELSLAIAQAAACDQYASVADFSVDANKFSTHQLDRIQNFRSLGRYQAWQMEVLVAEGQRDQAIRLGIELLRLAKLHEAEPMLTSYLVSIAVRGVAINGLYDALAAGPVSAETHAALDAELARQDDAGQLGRVLRTERAYAISTVDAHAAQSGWLAAPFAKMILRQQFGGLLDRFDALLPVADIPWHDPRSPRRAGNVLAPPTPLGVMAMQLLPAMLATYEAHTRDQAMIRALRTFNALRAFADKNGREAAGLAELDLPAEATIDPYSGAPLILKSSPQGWTVYAIGKDDQDNGGAVNDQRDIGLGPPRNP